MRVVMVSDAHLEGLDDPNQGALVSWLDAVESDRLVLLGDIFHHWWDFSGAVMSCYVPVCAALLRVRSRGIHIQFVPGNHDFSAGSFFEETLGAEVLGPQLHELDGVRYFLAHGDEADASFGYRLTRAILRGWAFDRLMQGLGAARGERLLRRLAGTSREHPAAEGDLRQAQWNWADQRLTEGADVVVMGHTHTPGVRRTEEGTTINTGDWQAHRSWLEVDEGRPRLLRQDGEEVVEIDPAATGA